MILLAGDAGCTLAAAAMAAGPLGALPASQVARM